MHDLSLSSALKVCEMENKVWREKFYNIYKEVQIGRDYCCNEMKEATILRRTCAMEWNKDAF